MRSQGSPLPTWAERFWAKVDRSGGADACWPWKAARVGRGYGRFGIEGKVYQAHRLAYELVVGPIAHGALLRHLECDNPPCCNPAHMAPGTAADNAQDAKNKHRTASGRKHGSITHPESRQRGEQHWTQRLPERISRGVAHALSTAPERRAVGKKHGSAQLTEEQVYAIRDAGAVGTFTYREIATRHGVQPSTAKAIIKRWRWKHLPER